MIKNWLKIAFRNLLRHKGYSLINLFGLAVGLTCAILILLYVRDELNYDRYPAKAGSIYRLRLEARTANRGQVRTVRTPPPWAPAVAKDYPEVLNCMSPRRSTKAGIEIDIGRCKPSKTKRLDLGDEPELIRS